MGTKVKSLETAKSNFRGLLEQAIGATETELQRREELRTSLLNGDGEEGLSGAVQGAGLGDVLVTDCIGLLPTLADLAEQAADEMVETAREEEQKAAQFYADTTAEWKALKGDDSTLAAVAEGSEMLALPKENWDTAKSYLMTAQNESRDLREWAETLRTPKIEEIAYREFADALETGDIDGDLGKAALLVSLRPYRLQIQSRLRYLDLDQTPEAVLISARLLPSGPVGTIAYTESQSQSASVGGIGTYHTTWQFGLLDDTVDTVLLEWLKRENLPRRKTAARRT